jgi:2-amino-4-hydroxy-6-hydroxymethyldihydropteridine diphosphokinase
VLAAAVAALAAGGLAPLGVARVRETLPLGPGSRRYANGAVLGLWKGSPEALLALCKQTERAFGRRRGRRWGDRVLDCDILLMADRTVGTPALIVPHPALADRDFMLDPLVDLWPDWRHPALGLTARQLRARLRRPRPVD